MNVTILRLRAAVPVLAIMWTIVPRAVAADGEVVLRVTNGEMQVKVDGDKDDDWWVQSSADLSTWTTLTNFGTLLSGNETNAVVRSLGVPSAGPVYYRALQTAGLYDITMLRTFSLTFTQADWSNLLVQARANGTYVYSPLLTLDNGATNTGVGARFRGNTSFTGMGGPSGSSGPVKKSIAIAVDYTITNANLMDFNSLNLNNAYGDETIMRESVYFTIMRQYTVCPAGCLAKLYINGEYRGVYSHAQQQNGDLIREYFPSNDGDRFRAANNSSSAAFVYLGNTNVATYTPYYELKSDYNSNAWPRFINAIYTFNTLPTNNLRDTAEDVIAVDRWLWFLACENIFADDDSYWNKGSDYMLYYEPESGRVHPVEHDGNEAFVAGDASLSPTTGETASRPVISRLLGNAELRQRYFAHMRTILQEWFNPTNAIALVDQFSLLSSNAIAADPYRGYTSMTTYSSDLTALKLFITNRYNYLRANANLTPLPPVITAVNGPVGTVTATNQPWLTATVASSGDGIQSVWLYHRPKPYGKFSYVQMYDDGAHGDGAAADGVFGAQATNYPAGSKVRYYVEARAANAAHAAAFSPPRAEQETYSYRVAVLTATNSPVILNEFMADNTLTYADPQGEFDDWIELHNVTDEGVDLTGRYLSDEPYNPRKWQFPAGTTIPAHGYLIVWADEDGSDSPGLHASFKLSKSGDEIYLTDTDANNNAILDGLVFGEQTTDLSYGRTAGDPDTWAVMSPTPNEANP